MNEIFLWINVGIKNKELKLIYLARFKILIKNNLINKIVLRIIIYLKNNTGIKINQGYIADK